VLQLPWSPLAENAQYFASIKKAGYCNHLFLPMIDICFSHEGRQHISSGQPLRGGIPTLFVVMDKGGKFPHEGKPHTASHLVSH
jgi:hypothetical protein